MAFWEMSREEMEVALQRHNVLLESNEFIIPFHIARVLVETGRERVRFVSAFSGPLHGPYDFANMTDMERFRLLRVNGRTSRMSVLEYYQNKRGINIDAARSGIVEETTNNVHPAQVLISILIM